MSKTKIMDGHEYFLREDGLWEAKDEFRVSIGDWVYNDAHIGKTCLFVHDRNKGWPRFVSEGDNTFKNLVRLKLELGDAWLVAGQGKPGDFIGGDVV